MLLLEINKEGLRQQQGAKGVIRVNNRCETV
jgi:hypothetical protein